MKENASFIDMKTLKLRLKRSIQRCEEKNEGPPEFAVNMKGQIQTKHQPYKSFLRKGYFKLVRRYRTSLWRNNGITGRSYMVMTQKGIDKFK